MNLRIFWTILVSIINPVIAMRAWTCHGRNQKELVDKLKQASIILSDRVASVMESVDRQYFCPSTPYHDSPQSIGLGQTISAPHMHAHALEEISKSLQESSSLSLEILDVGVGSGYLAACLGQLVHPPNPILGKTGKVYGIDVWPKLIEKSKKNIDDFNPSLLRDGTVQISLGDGWKGMEGHQFDAIHVGAAASQLPQILMMQLKVGGVMLIPVGPEGGVQILYRIQKCQDNIVFEEQNFAIKELLEVRYVPLIHPQRSQK